MAQSRSEFLCQTDVQEQLRQDQSVQNKISINAHEFKEALKLSNSAQTSSSFCLLTPTQSDTKPKNSPNLEEFQNEKLQGDENSNRSPQNDKNMQQQQQQLLQKQQNQFDTNDESVQDQSTQKEQIQQADSEIQYSCSGSNEVANQKVFSLSNEKLFEALESAILQTQFLEKLQAVQRLEDDYVFLENEIEPDYILVGQHEVIQAMSMYIAEYLYTLPEAKKLSPEDLHMALKKAFQELKKNHWKAVWKLGSNLYKGVQLACGTALMMENPWLIRAVGVFLWIFAKFLWYIPFAFV